MRFDGRVAAVAAVAGAGAHLVLDFPAAAADELHEKHVSASPGGMYRQFHETDSVLARNLHALLDSIDRNAVEHQSDPSHLAAALS
ncbi:hypothetical protein HDU82_008188, partial [Entophlyctis luteolus]